LGGNGGNVVPVLCKRTGTLIPISTDLIIKGGIIALLVFLIVENRILRKQNDILSEDVSGLSVAIRNSMDTSRNRFGQMEARTKTILLSQDQAQEYLSTELKDIKARFDTRINGLRAYMQTGLRYTVPVLAPGRDTTIYDRTEKVYYLPEGKLYTKNDTLYGTISISDTVRVVVYKGKRDKWWKIWKKRPLVTSAYQTNPDGTFTQLKSVLAQ